MPTFELHRLYSYAVMGVAKSGQVIQLFRIIKASSKSEAIASASVMYPDEYLNRISMRIRVVTYTTYCRKYRDLTKIQMLNRGGR